jgi:hypothetical protein
MVERKQSKGTEPSINGRNRPSRRSQEFRNESGRETDKAEAFADDMTGLTMLELESLSKLKQALFDFGEMSDLKCNVEKTVLMQVGNLIAPSNEILALGSRM